MKTELAWTEFEIAITSLLASSIWQQNQQGTSVHVGMLIQQCTYLFYTYNVHCTCLVRIVCLKKTVSITPLKEQTITCTYFLNSCRGFM